MANINSVITYNANLSPAQAQIKALTGQIGALSAAFNTLDKSALSAQRSLAATFAANAGQIGGFTAQTVKANSAVETFGKNLAANRLTMREYFREAITGYTRQNSMLRQLAAQQVRYQQSIAVSTGAGQAMMLTPQSINAASSAAQLASQRFSIFNQLIDGGATKMLNWGKNTQWAGRQLMVGFTVPLMLFTAVASKQFRDLDKELTRFQKVYGSDLGGAITESTQRMRDQVQQLAYDISRTYGIAAKDTAALAADIAATGAEGEELMSSIQQTTRLAVLGEVDRQEAMKATLALQSAFKMNTDELAESINFLNAVENQTSATLEDLSTAIPKVGPVVRSLGGDVKDLATLLVAMREGGIPAAEAANALKSGLASLINPTKQASEVAQKFGVDLVGIVEANKGQLMPTIYAVRNALSGLDDFARSKVIEQIFGKYQFARMSALFDNIGRTGSQTQAVLKLAAKSSTDLAAIANQEIKVLTESTAVKFQRTLEDLKNAIMPIGQTLTETLIPIFEFIGKGINTFSSFFQSLPEPVKNFAKYGIAIAALAGPVIMLVGLFGNLIANGIKFGMMMTRLGARIAGIKTEKFELLNADVMAAKFGVDNLTSSFTTQETAMKRLVRVMSAYEASLKRLTRANPALFIPGAIPGPRGAVPIKRQSGSSSPEFVPGSGSGDKIPAMLEPGEFVVNKDATEKYAPVLVAMNRGTLKGYENGGGTSRLAHLTRSVTVPITSAMDSATAGARRVLQQMLADGITEVKLFNNLVVSLSKATNDSLNTEVEGRGVKKSILAAELKDRERWSLMMKATGLSFEQLQPTIQGITGAMSRLEGELINDPQLYRLVEAELIKLSNAGDVAAQRLLSLSRQYGTVEYLRTDEGKVRPGRMALGVSTSGVGTYKGSRLAAESWARESTVNLERALDESVARAIQSSSPSRKSDSIGEKAGKNIGDGAIIGLERGLRLATSRQIKTGPIGPGLESRSTATVYQREQNARNLLEKALIKETQQTGLIADTKQRIVSQQKQHNIVLANWTKDLETGRWVHKDGTVAGAKRAAALDKLAQEESLLAAQEKKLRDIILIRERAEKNAASAAESKVLADKQLNQSIVKRSIQEGTMFTPGSYLMGGASPYAAGSTGRKSRFGDMSMDQRKALAAQRREAYLNNVGPGKSLKDARESSGMRGVGAMNAAMGASMLASTITMFSGATSEASSKIMMFTTALTTAIFALQAFSGTGIGGGIVGGVKKMGGGMAGLGARATAAAAGRGALTAGLLGGGGKALSGIGGALAGGGAAAAGTVAAVAIPLVITAAGLYMYKRSLDEAKDIANAAFAEPAKTAEFFGKSVDNVTETLKNINAAGASEELSEINSELRMAVSEDYAGLIDKLKTSVTSVGAADLGAAYTKMIISGMSAEEAQDAIKAIAAESGYAGGLAYSQAFSKGLLDAKSPEEAYAQTMTAITPESIQQQQNLTRDAMKQRAITNVGLYGRATPLVASGNFNNVLAGGPEFVQGLKASIEMSQTAPELVAENLDKIRESYLALNEDAGDILGMGTSAREMAFDEFKNMMGELDDPAVNELLDQLQDSTAETQALAIQMTALGVPLTEAKNAAGQFDDALARAAIENATRMAGLEKAVTDAKQALLDFAESTTIESQLSHIEDSVESMQNKIQDYTESRKEEREAIEESFEAEQKTREDSLDAMQEEMDAKRESFEEEMEQLDKKSEKIKDSSDAYIESLQKNQRAESFFAQQRKTAFGALQKLASGDVFGFLQEREQMSQDAQEYSYDQMIEGIEERRDLELDAIDDVREKRRKEQEDYEKIMQDKIDAIQEVMDKESELHEQNMENYDDETEKQQQEFQKRLTNRTQRNNDAKELIDGIKEGEIQSYKEVTKVFGEETGKRYEELVKAEMSALQLKLQAQVASGDVNKGDAERQLLDIYNSLIGASGYQGPEAYRRGAVTTYSGLQDVLGLPGFITRPPQRRNEGGKITGPGGPKSDVIPAMLSNGEYVIQASSVDKYGTNLMDSINTGKFAYGGYVGSADRQEYAASNRPTYYGGTPTSATGYNKPSPVYSGGTPTYSAGYTSAGKQAYSKYKKNNDGSNKNKSSASPVAVTGYNPDDPTGLRGFLDSIRSGAATVLDSFWAPFRVPMEMFGMNTPDTTLLGRTIGGTSYTQSDPLSRSLSAMSMVPFGKGAATPRQGLLPFTDSSGLPYRPSLSISPVEKGPAPGTVISIGRGIRGARGIAESGKFKNMFETNTTTGSTGFDDRMGIEHRGWGLPHNADPSSRPIYGLLRKEEEVTFPYGEFLFDIKYDPTKRTSYSPGDTKWFSPPKEGLPDLKQSHAPGEGNIGYAEVWQNNVKLSDVSRAHVAITDTMDDATVQEILSVAQMLRNKGVSVSVHGLETNLPFGAWTHRRRGQMFLPGMDKINEYGDSLMANGGLVQKFADGGLVEAMEKWFPKGGHQFYPGWNRFTSWAKGKPELITMHHTAGNWGQGELDYFAKDWHGVPVVQGFIRRTGTAHTIAGGNTGYGHGEGTTQHMGKNMEQAKELIDLVGHPNKTSWQIEVQSEGKTPDFTSGQFDAIARMTAAVRDWAGWPGFEGRIINHKDWAVGRRGDTLYPISTFVKNAEKVWEEGGGKPGNNGSNKGGKKPKDPKDPIGPMEAAPFRGLYGALNYLGSENQPKNKPDNNSNDPDNTGGKVTFKNIPDGYTEKDAFRTLDLIKAGGWPTRLHRLAWTIAMRESGGRNIYDTGDYGIFQLNKPNYGDQPWWTSDDKIQNDAVYNSTVAYKHVSSRGSNFLPWAMRINKDGGYEWDWRYYDPKPSWAGTTEKRTAAFWNSWQYKAGGGMMRLSGGGGAISGPGGPRSDMIPAMLSNGEYVVKASSVAKYGTGFMDQLNAGQLNLAGGGYIPKFANGGMVGSAAMPAFNMPEMANTSVGMTNNNYAGNTSSNSSNTNVKVVINGAGGKSANAIANKVISMINDASSRRNHSRSI